MSPSIAAFASLVVPGVGQLVRGRVVDGALFFFAGSVVHAFILGVVLAVDPEAERWAALLSGAFGAGVWRPTATVMSVLCLALHVWAAVDATKDNGRVGIKPNSPG